jgi:hypothetical protein
MIGFMGSLDLAMISMMLTKQISGTLFCGLDDDGLFGGEGVFAVLAIDGDFVDATGEGG